jgi:ribose transport system substrate-binding protein
MKDEAEVVGVKKLLVTNAQSQLSKQISDIQDMISQGAQALVIAPLNSTGLEPALEAAKAEGIPVIAIDRKLDGAEPCSDYLTFIGSNFVEQGERAAAQMIEATGGTGKVAILLGSSGNNVTTDRNDGFLKGIEGSELEVIAQQTGNFNRQEGQSVTEQFLQSNPDLTAIYAHNDEMALGAIVALKSAGKEPGQDVKVISIDGTRGAVQAVADGTINGVVESNPRFGPIAFDTLESFLSGEPIPDSLIISDKEFTPENAADEVANAY